MHDRLETWARTAVWAVPAYGVLLAISSAFGHVGLASIFGVAAFAQPAIGVVVAGVAIARVAAVADRARAVVLADGMTLR